MSLATARRIALAAQGFADARPRGRVDVRHLRRGLARVGVLQIDSINVLVRSHWLPLYSRLGPYPRSLLVDMTERRRELFEYWAHMASFVPVDLHPLLRWRMARAAGDAWGRMKALQRDRPGYVEAVYAEVEARGPLTAGQLSDPGTKGGNWWGWAHGKTALEWLFWCGRVTSAGRGRNFERMYDLTERVLPPEVLARTTPAEADAQRALLELSGRLHGIGTARDLADYFRIRVPQARPLLHDLVEAGALVPVRVEGWREPAYLHPEARTPRRVEARALLSPFDSLVWERSRTERLFGMQFRLEVYTPSHKRVHGYYVLPFLLGEHLVARVDVKADRASSTLRVHATHVEPAFAARHDDVREELAAELRTMADWLELDEVALPPGR